MNKFVLFILFCSVITFSQFENANAMSVYNIGDIKVISIQDKTMEMNVDFFATSDDVKKTYTPSGVCEASLNVFIVVDGDVVTLIDTGFGALGNGKIIENMKSAGYTPDMIDNILITHMHGDHISGALAKDGDKFTRVFKNARVYIQQFDYDYWVTLPKKEGKTTLATNFADTYDSSIRLFSNNVPIASGVVPIQAYGHTVGHTMFEISSKGEKMLIVADIIHCLPIQINDVEASIKFDTNPDQAIETRKKVLEYVYKNDVLIGGMHIPYPGVGYVTKKNGKYSFIVKK